MERDTRPDEIAQSPEAFEAWRRAQGDLERARYCDRKAGLYYPPEPCPERESRPTERVPAIDLDES